MSWIYRSPLGFPAVYFNSLKTAAACPENSVLVIADKSYKKVQKYAETFRHFKWCIRQRPDVVPDLWKILETYEIRSKIVSDEIGYMLYIVARSTKLSEFQRLNPTLAHEIGSIVND